MGWGSGQVGLPNRPVVRRGHVLTWQNTALNPDGPWACMVPGWWRSLRLQVSVCLQWGEGGLAFSGSSSPSPETPPEAARLGDRHLPRARGDVCFECAPGVGVSAPTGAGVRALQDGSRAGSVGDPSEDVPVEPGFGRNRSLDVSSVVT